MIKESWNLIGWEMQQAAHNQNMIILPLMIIATQKI